MVKILCTCQCIIYNGDENMTTMYVHNKWRAIMVLKNYHFEWRNLMVMKK